MMLLIFLGLLILLAVLSLMYGADSRRHSDRNWW